MRRISRRHSIAEVMRSINANLKSTSKLIFDTLANTENSIKYNLDSQNINLFYSITPSYDIANSSKVTTMADDISEDYEITIEFSRNSFVPNASRRLLVSSNQESEIHARAENFIDQLIFDVNCLKLTRDISNCSKSQLHHFIQEKVLSVKNARKTAKKTCWKSTS